MTSLDRVCSWNPPLSHIREREMAGAKAGFYQEREKKEKGWITRSATENLVFLSMRKVSPHALSLQTTLLTVYSAEFSIRFYVKCIIFLALCSNLVSFLLNRDHNGNPTIKTLKCYQKDQTI